MANTKLNIAFWDYDRTRPLVDGSVTINGVDGTFHSAPIVTEIFRGMIADHSFDVSELGFTYFLRTFKDGNLHSSPFLSFRIAPFGTLPSSSIKPAVSKGLRT